MNKKAIGVGAAMLALAGVSAWYAIEPSIDTTPLPDASGMCHTIADRHSRSYGEHRAPPVLDGVYEFGRHDGLLIRAPYHDSMHAMVCPHLYVEAFFPEPAEGSITMFCKLDPQSPIQVSTIRELKHQGQAGTFTFDLGCIAKEWAANDGRLQARCWRGSDTYTRSAQLHQAIVSYPCGGES